MIKAKELQPVKLEYTDQGNAELLIEHAKDKSRFCPGMGWMYYDGKRWIRDDIKYIVNRAAHIFGRMAYKATTNVEQKHYTESVSMPRLHAAVSLAEHDPLMVVRQLALDNHPNLLNCENGTIDLDIGDLLPHNPEHLITNICDSSYDPSARLDEWDKVILQITKGNKQMQNYLQRASGCSIYGKKHEDENIFFIYGPTKTCKSSFIERILETLGTYGKKANFSSFTKSNKGNGPRNDIAGWNGARLIVSNEAKEGEKFDTEVIKKLASSDRITERLLHKEYIEFYPTFNIWLCANDAPEIALDDEAMWRRLVRIPFSNQIKKVIPSFTPILRDKERGKPAILAYLVQGYLDYKTYGLAVPESIQEQTYLYKQENSPLKDFFEVCIASMIIPGSRALRSSVWRTYKRYLEIHGLTGMRKSEFFSCMQKCGYNVKEMNNEMYFIGIVLKSEYVVSKQDKDEEEPLEIVH